MQYGWARLAIVAFFLGVIAFSFPAWALTIAWDNPTTFVDGRPATPADIAMINVYRNHNNGVFALYTALPGAPTTYTDPAPVTGSNGYYITAVGTGGLESMPSPSVVVRFPHPKQGVGTGTGDSIHRAD